MKFGAIALDYDGTTAVDGVLDPDVRQAVAGLRRRGIVAVLATGRRLADLHALGGDLSCFDVIVGENGAVLEYPHSGRHVRLARPASPHILAELRRRGIPYDVGECVIEADARWGTPVLEAIRELEQPLTLTFNRSRLMVLPQGVCKSAGLRRALQSLRASVHNAVAIGDAENDHDLLEACEIGVAVSWGSPALRAVADEVVEGDGPSDVAAFLHRLAPHAGLSHDRLGRRRLQLGQEFDGTPVDLAVRGRTILIAGEPGTGKSWLAGLLCEQLILQDYSLCILDPEGDYRTLEALPGVVTLGGPDPPPHARELERALRHPDASLIVDLSRLAHRDKHVYIRSVLPVLAKIRRATGLPHKILLDEAHYFLDRPESASLMDPELAGYILVTYRVSRIDPGVRRACAGVVLVTRESDPDEAAALGTLCHPSTAAGAVWTMLAELRMSEAALLPGVDEAGGVRRFILAPRLTAHVRHREKYLEMPVGWQHAFVFTDGGRPIATASTLHQFIRQLVVAPAAVLEGHIRRHDFSRWIDHVFMDAPLAARVCGLEDRLDGESPTDTSDAIAQLIRARYETPVVAP